MLVFLSSMAVSPAVPHAHTLLLDLQADLRCKADIEKIFKEDKYDLWLESLTPGPLY